MEPALATKFSGSFKCVIANVKHVIFQDTDDFLWVATRFGLNRFDGTAFKHWTTEETGYNFNNISKIGQDDAGWLWLWNEESITFLHPQTEEIQSLAEHFPDGVAFETQLKKNCE